MPDIRLIAMDMDGTLLDGHEGICPENLNALKKAQEKGIVIAICSGRFPENASLIVEDCGLTCPIIGTNGGEITDAPMGKILFRHEMDNQAARAVHAILVKMQADYFTFSTKLVTTSAPDARHHSELSAGTRLQKAGMRYAHGEQAMLDALDYGVNKFFISDTGNLPEIREALSAIPNIALTRSSEFNIEVMPLGVDKGTGVQELAEFLHIPLSQVMTLGDQDNDLPMLTRVGYGVAMGNAPDEIKRQARFTTARYDEAGVAKAIERFAL